jgi:hypothetical protein
LLKASLALRLKTGAPISAVVTRPEYTNYRVLLCKWYLLNINFPLSGFGQGDFFALKPGRLRALCSSSEALARFRRARRAVALARIDDDSSFLET